MYIQKKLRTKATEAEKTFYQLTKDLGLNLVFQKKWDRVNGRHYYIDFSFSVNRRQLAALRDKKWPVVAKHCRRRLFVEIDGPYHDSQLAYDFQREQEIINKKSKRKVYFLRFSNDDVMYRTQEVLSKLYSKCKEIWGISLEFSDVRYQLAECQNYPIKVYDF